MGDVGNTEAAVTVPDVTDDEPPLLILAKKDQQLPNTGNSTESSPPLRCSNSRKSSTASARGSSKRRSSVRQMSRVSKLMAQGQALAEAISKTIACIKGRDQPQQRLSADQEVEGLLCEEQQLQQVPSDEMYSNKFETTDGESSKTGTIFDHRSIFWKNKTDPARWVRFKSIRRAVKTANRRL